jgi:hypothetical protein
VVAALLAALAAAPPGWPFPFPPVAAAALLAAVVYAASILRTQDQE